LLSLTSADGGGAGEQISGQDASLGRRDVALPPERGGSVVGARTLEQESRTRTVRRDDRSIE